MPPRRMYRTGTNNWREYRWNGYKPDEYRFNGLATSRAVDGVLISPIQGTPESFIWDSISTASLVGFSNLEILAN